MKHLEKIIGLVAGFAMAVAVGAGVISSNSSKIIPVHAESLAYTIEMKDNGKSDDDTTAKTALADIISSGDSYVSSVTASKIYQAKSGYGIKGGSSSAKGSLDLVLSQSGQVDALKVSFNLAMYDSGKTVKVYFNGSSTATTLTPSTSFNEYEITIEDTITEIKIESTNASKNRFYLKSISVYVDSTPTCTHNWVAGTVHAPTCTEGGYTEYECSLCHETKQDDITTALGHDYGEWTITMPATCTEAGEKTRVCTRDASHIEIESIPATGHHYVDGICEICGAKEPVNPLTLFTKITDTADITDGKYLIVYDTICFDGSLTTLDAASNTKDVSLTNLLTSYWTITDGKIKSASGYYIGSTADKNELLSSTSYEYTNTISIDASGNLEVLSSGGTYLRYNKTAGQERFRYFKSSTYTAQQAIQLYKVNLDAVILNEITCDSTGATPPQGSWTDLKTYYSTLSTNNKTALKTATGDGLIKYDYIVGKYNYENFIGRSVASSSSKAILNTIGNESSNSIIVITIITLVSLTSLSLFLIYHKKHQYK